MLSLCKRCAERSRGELWLQIQMMRAAGDLEPAALGGTYSCRIMVWRLTNASALAAVFRVASSCTHPIRHQFRRLFDDVNDERKEDGTSFWLESNTHSPSSSCRNMRHDSSRISVMSAQTAT